MSPPGIRQSAASLSQVSASSIVRAWLKVPKGKNARCAWAPAHCTGSYQRYAC